MKRLQFWGPLAFGMILEDPPLDALFVCRARVGSNPAEMPRVGRQMHNYEHGGKECANDGPVLFTTSGGNHHVRLVSSRLLLRRNLVDVPSSGDERMGLVHAILHQINPRENGSLGAQVSLLRIQIRAACYVLRTTLHVWVP